MTTTAQVDGLTRPRRRRAWPFVLIGVLVLLVVAAVVADAAARSYAEGRIRTELVSALGIPASTTVGVDLGPGSVLLQALSGHLDTLDVTVPSVSYGGLAGSATVHATRVPLDRSQPVGTLRIAFTVGEKDLTALAGDLSGITLTSITLKAPDIVGTGSASVLGVAVPVSIGVTPSASGGALVFTPSTISLSGKTFTAAQLTSNPLFGGIAKTLLASRSLCVAQDLPKALTIESVAVQGSGLVITAEGDGAVLSGAAFSTKGSCS